MAATKERLERRDFLPLLWADETGTLVNFRQLLKSLRTLPGAETWLDAGGASVSVKADTDLQRFLSCAAAARYADALAEWRRDRRSYDQADHFLHGLKVRRVSRALDEWLDRRRGSLNLHYQETLRAAAEHAFRTGQSAAAVERYRDLITQDPLEELTLQQLMRLELGRDRPLAAMAQFEVFRDVLTRELDAQPLPETLALFKEAKQAVITLDKATSLAFPKPLTKFIGRQSDLAKLSEMLGRETCRLITLIGPGGVGKTRLTLEIARQLAPSYADEAQFVSLESVNDPDAFMDALARGLGLNFTGTIPVTTQLLDHFAQTSTLLVLDNFDQLTDQANLLSKLLEQSPRSRMVVTSRKRLNIPGEHLYDVGGMTYPDEPDLANFASYDAVQLFCQAVLRLRPTFRLTEDDYEPLWRICDQVHGLPLALELAASWVRTLSIHGVAEAIEQGHLLGTELETLPERHRSLQIVLEGVWQNLDRSQKKSLTSLSVFRGGFDAAAALGAAEVTLPCLIRLADVSLVQADGRDRFDLHPVVYAFAETKLSQSEQTRLRTEHATYFHTLALTAAPELKGSKQATWLDKLDVELANLRSAFHTFAAEGMQVSGLDMCLALQRYFSTRGYYREAEALLHTFLSDSEVSERTGKGYAALSIYAYSRGDLTLAADRSRQAFEVYQQLNDAVGCALELGRLGTIYRHQARFDEAERLFQESFALYETVDRPELYAGALNNYGQLLRITGAKERALGVFKRSLELFQRAGDLRNISIVLSGLGDVAVELGKYDEAESYLERCLDLKKEVGDRWGEALTYNSLAVLYRHKDATNARARRFTIKCLTLAEELGDKRARFTALSNLGELAVLDERWDDALSLLKQAVTLGLDQEDKRGVSINLFYLAFIAAHNQNWAVFLRLYGHAKEVFRQLDLSEPSDLEVAPFLTRAAAHVDVERYMAEGAVQPTAKIVSDTLSDL